MYVDSIGLLQVVTGHLQLDSNRALTSIIFPSLAAVGDYFLIKYNPALTLISAARLITVGAYVQIVGNQELTQISADNLTHTGGRFEAGTNNNLTQISVASLSKVDDNFAIYDNGKLTRISADNLQRVAGRVYIAYNSKLKISKYDGLANLTCVGDILSTNLDDCSAALKARVAAAAAAWDTLACTSTSGKVIDGDFALAYATAAAVCHLLEGVTRINGNLTIGISGLIDLACLSSLQVGRCCAAAL